MIEKIPKIKESDSRISWIERGQTVRNDLFILKISARDFFPFDDINKYQPCDYKHHDK